MYHEAKIRRLIPFVLFFFLAGLSLAAQHKDALLQYRSGNYGEAIDICKQEIAADSANVEAYVVLCWSLLKLGRYAEADVYAQAAAKIARYDARVIEIRGETNFYQGRNAPALQYFQEYINLLPEGQRIDAVYYYMGEIYIRLGRYKHADIALSTALHFDPKSALWWTRLAYAREMSADYTESMRAYLKALELTPNFSDANRGLERVRAIVNAR